MKITRITDSYFIGIIIVTYSAIALMAYKHALRIAANSATINSHTQAVDLIIFSYNRPMQLYALLESIKHNITGLESSTVIYRTTDDHYADAYTIVAQIFPNTCFIKQGKYPANDFKPLTLQAFRAGSSPYICFAVDDLIVKAQTDLKEATRALASTNAYGFYLRLGTHLTNCYTENQIQPKPVFTPISDSILSWKLKDGKHDWGYINTVDMTIYRKKDIIEHFITMNYANPNKLEGTWARYAKEHQNQRGLCYNDSVVVNIPMNLVQDVCNNRHMNAYSAEELLEKFNLGLKINLDPLHAIKNKSCHIEYPLTFILR